jgi:hypothetical protein
MWTYRELNHAWPEDGLAEADNPNQPLSIR